MKIKSINSLSILTLHLVAATAGQGAVLDFETVRGAVPFEGMVISNQYQQFFGVRFAGLRSNDVPIIVKRGYPQAAFDYGYDDIDPTDSRFNQIGDFFLGAQRAAGYPWGLTLLFDAPISTVSFYALDLDNREVITASGYAEHNDSNAIITSIYASASADGPQPTDRGNGNTTLVTVTATNQSALFSKLTISITRSNANGGNLAFDHFSYDYVPTNPGPSALSVQMLPGLTIHGAVGWPYRIDYADRFDITAGVTNWHPLTNLFLPSSPYLFFDSSAPPNPQRFYRAVTDP